MNWHEIKNEEEIIHQSGIQFTCRVVCRCHTKASLRMGRGCYISGVDPSVTIFPVVKLFILEIHRSSYGWLTIGDNQEGTCNRCAGPQGGPWYASQRQPRSVAVLVRDVALMVEFQGALIMGLRWSFAGWNMRLDWKSWSIFQNHACDLLVDDAALTNVGSIETFNHL